MASPRRPESVLVIVYSMQGNVLLLKRTVPFDFWQSVTGSLEANETPFAAARRELCEETGLVDDELLTDSGRHRVFEIDRRWRNRYAAGITQNTEYEWHFCVEESAVIRLDGNEHTESKWVPFADAVNLVWSWTNQAALRALQSELRTNSQSV